jgi:hypothetical protein
MTPSQTQSHHSTRDPGVRDDILRTSDRRPPGVGVAAGFDLKPAASPILAAIAEAPGVAGQFLLEREEP